MGTILRSIPVLLHLILTEPWGISVISSIFANEEQRGTKRLRSPSYCMKESEFRQRPSGLRTSALCHRIVLFPVLRTSPYQISQHILLCVHNFTYTSMLMTQISVSSSDSSCVLKLTILLSGWCIHLGDIRALQCWWEYQAGGPRCMVSSSRVSYVSQEHHHLQPLIPKALRVIVFNTPVILTPLISTRACFSRVQLCATLRTVARQAPLSMGFPGKNTGVGCHFLLHLMSISHIKHESDSIIPLLKIAQWFLIG